MTWPKVEEINANTNAARDEIKGNTDTAKNEIKTYTAEEIAAAIQTLQSATESARDTILANLTSGGAVKKVQRGEISVGNNSSETATISSVNTAKAVVLFGGSTCGSDSSSVYGMARVVLTSATVVTAYRSVRLSTACKVPYQVVEFY